jgi:hypothetical protein
MISRRAISALGARLMLPAAFGDDGHADVFGLANDAQNQVRAKQATQEITLGGPSYEDLGNLIAARKIDDGFGAIVSLQHSRLNVKIFGKVQMLLNRVHIRRQAATVAPR